MVKYLSHTNAPKSTSHTSQFCRARRTRHLSVSARWVSAIIWSGPSDKAFATRRRGESVVVFANSLTFDFNLMLLISFWSPAWLCSPFSFIKNLYTYLNYININNYSYLRFSILSFVDAGWAFDIVVALAPETLLLILVHVRVLKIVATKIRQSGQTISFRAFTRVKLALLRFEIASFVT